MSSRIDSINMPWATQAMKSRMLSAPESGARHCERLGGQLCWRCMYLDLFPWRQQWATDGFAKATAHSSGPWAADEVANWLDMWVSFGRRFGFSISTVRRMRTIFCSGR
jgi:hypothetical protein